MAFDLRCPDCRTKLRLDEEPDPDAPIECPKCGKTFTAGVAALLAATSDAPAKTKKSKKGKGPKEPKESKEKPDKPQMSPQDDQERTFMNPFLLLGMILAGFAAYAIVCSMILAILGAAGRVTDMLAYLPKDCTIIRGANLQILNAFPGYKQELDKYLTPPIAAGLDAITTAIEAEDKDALRDYMIAARTANGSPVFVFRSQETLDPVVITEKLGAKPAGGTDVYLFPPTAPGMLANGLIHFPTSRRFILVPPSLAGDQAAVMKQCITAIDDSDQSFVSTMTDTSTLVTGKHAWMLIRTTGLMKPIASSLSIALKKDFPVFSKQAETTTELGMWNSFGAKVRFGGAMDCGDEDAAAALVKALKDGPMGQGDSSEIPNDFKMLVYYSQNKEFREFLGNMSFRYQGTSAYFLTSMAGDNAKKVLESVGLPQITEKK